MTVDRGKGIANDSFFFEQSPCALFITDLDGTLLKANKTFFAWLQYSASDLYGKRKVQDLLNMGGKIFYQTHVAPLLKMQGSIAEVKLQMKKADGAMVPVMLNGVRVEPDGERYYQFALILANDRHKYEKELLQEREKARSLLTKHLDAEKTVKSLQESKLREAHDRTLFAEQMIGIVSHDLRNPLNAILMGLQILRTHALTDVQARYVERMSKASGRAHRLIRDLLDFTLTRVGNGLLISMRSVDLHTTVNDAVEELRLNFPEHKLIHEPVGKGSVEIDPDRFYQIIGNLVSNAAAYGSAQRPIVVMSFVKANEFGLKVTNYGPVIPEDKINSLFDPMTRGNVEPTEVRSVGLGLYIVKQIALAHRGRALASSSEDEGTQFIVSIPKSDS